MDLVEQQLRVAGGEPLTVEPRQPEATRSRCASTRSTRYLPPPGRRLERLELPDTVRVDAGSRPATRSRRLRPADRQADRARETREEASTTSPRAPRDARGGRDHEPRFLRGLVDHPDVAPPCDDRVPGGHPPLSPPTSPPGPWSGAWRLNRDRTAVPPPPLRPPPTVEQSAHAADSGGEQSAITAPMPASSSGARGGGDGSSRDSLSSSSRR